MRACRARCAAAAAADGQAARNLIPLRLDTPFKRAFQRRDTLAHLLNAVLGDAEEHRVVAISSVELRQRARSCIFDILCTLADGTNVIVELQKANMREELVSRLVGWGRSYSEQSIGYPGGGTAGPQGHAPIPVRMVAIADFTLEPSAGASGSLVQRFPVSARAGAPAPSVRRGFPALLDATLVQLPLAPPTAEPGHTPAQLWAHLLRYSERYRMPTLPPPLRAAPYAAAAESARADVLMDEEVVALEEEDKALRDALRTERIWQERYAAVVRVRELERQRELLLRQLRDRETKPSE